MSEGAQVTVGGIDPSDLVPNEQQRAEALKDFLSGSPFGAPDREAQVGLTSQPPDEMFNRPAPPTFEQQVEQANQRIAELNEPVAHTQPDQDWRSLYGRSENEKGEWRRKAAELEETLNLILSQQQAAPPQSTMPTNYSMPYQGQQPAYVQPQVDPFEGLVDDDVVQGKQIRQILERTVAPALMGAYQQAQQAQAEVARMQREAFGQAKRAAGIDNLADLRFRAKYPQFAAMPDTVEKLNLMQTLMKIEQPMQPNAAPTYPSAPTNGNPTQNIVRRVTYTENNRGVAGEPNTDRNAMFQAKMAEAAKLPFHQRATAMKAVFKEFEVPQINTFGTGRFRV